MHTGEKNIGITSLFFSIRKKIYGVWFSKVWEERNAKALPIRKVQTPY
jgi:hypothetical protein